MGEKILLVDDDSDMLLLESRWLTKEGYEVETKLEAFAPRLVLLDFSMPGMNGVETLRNIRSIPGGEDIAVFFLTGLEDETLLAEAKELRPAGFLSKGEGKKPLLAALSAYLEEG